MKRLWVAVFFTILFIVSLVAYFSQNMAPNWAQNRDSLTIGTTQFPSTFHPSIDSMLAKSYVQGLSRRPFTAYDKDWKLTCLLCTELPTIENGGAVREGEGIAVTFTIHPDATWGDGVPVTTKDVVLGWEVGKHPLSGVASGELFRRILSIDAVSDKTFTLHMDRVQYDYNAIGDLNLLPAHLERAKFEADPAAYRTQTVYDTEPTHPGLGYGPYRLSEVKRGSHLVYETNPTWYGKAPTFKRIIVKAVENTAALEANLLSDGVDMISGELGLTVDQAIAFEKRHGESYNVRYKPGLIYEHLDVNLDNPILQDVKVRRALMHALDRDGLNQQLFAGKQPVADSNVNPLDEVYSKDTPTYPYDPAKAAALLDEAGWKLGAGGVRQNAVGEKLSLTLMTTAGNRTRELVEQVLQSQWKQAGLDITIRNEPARVFFGETVTKRKFPALAMFAWISSPESVPRYLHSSELPTKENNWSGQNSTGYSSPVADKLIDAIEVELDKEKRKGMWRELQDLYATELPALPLYFRAESYILPKWLRGVEPTGHQYPTTLWVEEWAVE